ncbi:hypothetical protein [Sporisorium scitamineum]|uniref:Uncharacterized protein n=1 Tax=Sporisorium scitamineum TaxID=49012 RepID=A0A0F7S784_9BASI|nr:hypothetical protein [Sporisorium scitamineum]
MLNAHRHEADRRNADRRKRGAEQEDYNKGQTEGQAW